MTTLIIDRSVVNTLNSKNIIVNLNEKDLCQLSLLKLELNLIDWLFQFKFLKYLFFPTKHLWSEGGTFSSNKVFKS